GRACVVGRSLRLVVVRLRLRAVGGAAVDRRAGSGAGAGLGAHRDRPAAAAGPGDRGTVDRRGADHQGRPRRGGRTVAGGGEGADADRIFVGAVGGDAAGPGARRTGCGTRGGDRVVPRGISAWPEVDAVRPGVSTGAP